MEWVIKECLPDLECIMNYPAFRSVFCLSTFLFLRLHAETFVVRALSDRHILVQPTSGKK